MLTNPLVPDSLRHPSNGKMSAHLSKQTISSGVPPGSISTCSHFLLAIHQKPAKGNQTVPLIPTTLYSASQDSTLCRLPTWFLFWERCSPTGVLGWGRQCSWVQDNNFYRRRSQCSAWLGNSKTTKAEERTEDLYALHGLSQPIDQPTRGPNRDVRLGPLGLSVPRAHRSPAPEVLT